MNDDARGLQENIESKVGDSKKEFAHEAVVASIEDKKAIRENAIQARIHTIRHDLGVKTFDAKPVKQKTEVEVITSYAGRREKLRDLAYEQLEKKLTDRESCCPKCFGSGENGEKTCSTCKGTGVVLLEADMRAIELILKPDYPKTSLAVTANIDSMKPEEIMNLLNSMYRKKNV